MILIASAWKWEDQNLLKDVASTGHIICAANPQMKSERRKSFGASADEDGVVNCARKVRLNRYHSIWCRRRDSCHRRLCSHGCYWCCEAEDFYAESGARATGLATDTRVTSNRFVEDTESTREVGAEND